jgi:NADH-quinone oxidoreductase subunit A
VAQYLPIFTLLVLALVFAAMSFVMSSMLAPKNPNAAKASPYECGIVPSRESQSVERFPVRFYVVAMLFIIFDIEIIFLYPWAVANRALGTYGLIAMIVFAAVVFISLLYEIAMGGLEWGPAKRMRPLTDIPTGRSTSDTITRVAAGKSADEAAA